MQIHKAEFRCSSERISQVPKDSLKDIAFIGRSNVKSSLINMLTGRQGLAKVSGTPGKTRLINHFLIDNAWYLVDLPGYGYARTSKAVRGEFAEDSSPTTCSAARSSTSSSCWSTSASNPRRSTCASSRCSARTASRSASSSPRPTSSPEHDVTKSVERYQAKRSPSTWEELPPMFVSSGGARHGARRDPRLHRRMPRSLTEC